MLRTVVIALGLVMTHAHCAAPQTYGSADTAPRAFELGGYVETRLRHYEMNGDGAAYQVRYGDPPRNRLERSTAQLRFLGSARAESWSMRFQTLSEVEHTAVSHEVENRFDELLASWKPHRDFALDAGKVALKWGQGYSWNPVAFVERPKDPNDPRQAREGYVLLAANITHEFSGPLQSVKLTPVLLPVTEHVNRDFGKPDHLNLAGKLQFDFDDTDVALYFLDKGSRARRFGFDFSYQHDENLGFYGEWARVSVQEFRLVTSTGTRYGRSDAASNYTLGARYQPDARTHVIAELHHNGTGLTSQEFREFASLAQDALQSGSGTTLMARARAAAEGQYGRSKPMQNYLYVRAGRTMIPFSPSIRATVNLQDRSYSITPEVNYAGTRHWGLRLRYTVTGGGNGTEYGEKYYERILDVRVHYHF